MTDYFLSHMMIEFIYNENRKFGFYFNESVFHTEQMFEKYGVFSDCKNIAEEIISTNYNSQNILKIQISENSLTDSVILDFTVFDNIDAAYEPSVSVYNNVKKKFDEITIVISNKNSLNLPTIMHELQHAKEDLEFRKKGYDLSTIMNAYGYTKLDVNTTKYEHQREIQHILYYFNRLERNAFITSIKGELEECDKTTFRTIDEVSQYIKNTDFYKTYETVLTNCDYFLKIKNKNTKSIILSCVNEKSNHNFKTYHQFTNWLKGKMIQCKQKFNTIVPKISYSFFESKMSTLFSLPTKDIIKVQRIDEFIKTNETI